MEPFVKSGMGAITAALLLISVAGAQVPAGIETLAEEAYIFAFPMLEHYRTMYRAVVDQQSRVDPQRFNRFTHAVALAGPESRLVVRQNNDTLYSLAWLDLRAEPVVILLPAIPQNRYWSLQLIDIYTHNLAILSSRTRGPVVAAGRYLVAGPNWKGTVPSGMTQVSRSESNLALAIVRVAVHGPDDAVNVSQLQQAYALAPLHEVVKGPAPPSPALLDFPPFDRQQARTGFVRYVNFLLGQLEIHPTETALISRFARIGIAPNRRFDARTLDDRTRNSIETGVAAAVAKIRSTQLGPPKGTWRTASEGFGNRDRMQGRYLVRAAAAMYGLYGLDAQEAIYMGTASDADGNPLNAAARRYILRFSRQQIPPARAFWSLTMYDQDGFMVANPKRRYSIGDRTPDLKYGDDRSLTVYLQDNAPGPQEESNWLPTPRGPFSLVLRLYLPESGANNYVPPQVEVVR
jgi:hypothetical protein